MSRVQIQVTGEWAGATGAWRPAISGTLNQTGDSDESASTFDSEEAAESALESVVDVQRAIGDGNEWVLSDDVPYDGEWRRGAPRFRIVEIEGT